MSIQEIVSAIFIAFLIMVVGAGLHRRFRLAPEQRRKEDAEPFDDAW